MTAKYFAILTNQGAARLANATALGTQLNLTQMAVGDANGTLPTPDPAQTKLVNQKRIAPLNLLAVDPNNTSQIIAEQIIPENEGGFWIREIGLYDDDGILIAVANCPETYKPQLQEGSGRTQTIRMILIVSSTSSISLKIDPSVVLATRQYVDDKVIEVKGYADDQMKKHKNLGLGEGSALPVGVPVPWPSATPPTGWLKCNGAAFTASQYPKLALAYPALKLPDLRAEFIRGWDDGRGIDSGRGLLSAQFGSGIGMFVGGYSDGTAYIAVSDFDSVVDNSPSWSHISTAGIISSITGQKSSFGARPRNIAFNYIVRAA
ncbi:MAG: phage tail protein [Enterobacter asburiae]|nr:phage tail protein [Enterobacter asburiae]